MAKQEHIESAWDKVKSYVRIPRDEETGEGSIVLTFLENEPQEIKTSGKFGNEQFIFNVMHDGEEKLFSVSAVRLLSRLKDLRPLKGKVLKIEVEGTGTESMYNVLE